MKKYVAPCRSTLSVTRVEDRLEDSLSSTLVLPIIPIIKEEIQLYFEVCRKRRNI